MKNPYVFNLVTKVIAIISLLGVFGSLLMLSGVEYNVHRLKASIGYKYQNGHFIEKMDFTGAYLITIAFGILSIPLLFKENRRGLKIFTVAFFCLLFHMAYNSIAYIPFPWLIVPSIIILLLIGFITASRKQTIKNK